MAMNKPSAVVSEMVSSSTLSRSFETESSSTLLHPRQRLAEIVSDPSLSKPDQISLCHEQVGILHLANSVTNDSDSFEYNSANNFAEPEQMKNNDRTLKELATPDVVYQPWCIQYPQLEPAQTYELKSGLIHLLPIFHGLAREDPHKHLKEFHVVCSTMRPQGILEDYIKMKAFSFSLDRAPKDWLYLQPFFPASRIATTRKEICRIRQHSGKTLHEYWERFNKLCGTCPHHQISEQLPIQYFYEGLTMMDQSMIDAASVGALMDKTPVEFGIRGASQSWMVIEIGAVDNLRLENQLTKLTSLVRQLAVGQPQPSIASRVCGICTSMEHPTDMCPTLQETESDHPESIGAIGGYQYGKVDSLIINNLEGNHFGQGRVKGLMRLSDLDLPQMYLKLKVAPPFQQQQQQRMPSQGNSPSLEDLMKQLAMSNLEFQQSINSSNMQFQQNMSATTQYLKTQIG
ncbi:hypothetical protein CR513_51034, partial [Mucuna pruriens]